MRYGHVEQSVRLLDGAPPAAEAKLSRRKRYAALASDRDGDVAAALFLRRGVNGEPRLDVHHLEKKGSSWRLLGGGGSNAVPPLTPRPTLHELGSAVIIGGKSGTLRNADRLMPWGAKWVWSVELRLALEVVALRVADRQVPVAPHGLAVVVWARHPPAVETVDVDERSLGTIRISLIG